MGSLHQDTWLACGTAVSRTAQGPVHSAVCRWLLDPTDQTAEPQTSCSRAQEMVMLTEINGTINPLPLHPSIPKRGILTECAMTQEYTSAMKAVPSC